MILNRIQNPLAKVLFRVPTHLKKSFSILFQYLSNTKLKKFNTVTSLNFSKFLIMKINFAQCISALPAVQFCSDT